jgi:H+/Cl- antiporter ClcA
MVVVPVVGGLFVGLMARFGSDKIRGHGIPEAIRYRLLTVMNGRLRTFRVGLLPPHF